MLHPSPHPTRVPREGGDPEQGQPAFGLPQVWAPAFAGDADEGDYHFKSASAPWVASLRSQ